MIRLLLAVLVLLALVALVVWLLAQRRRARTARWVVAERSDGEAVLVFAERAGQRPMLVERVALADPEFELRVEEARAMARGKVVALNSGLPAR